MLEARVVNREQIKVLHQVLSKYCEARGFDPDSSDWQLIATRLMWLFQRGLTSAEDLEKGLLTFSAESSAPPSAYRQAGGGR